MAEVAVGTAKGAVCTVVGGATTDAAGAATTEEAAIGVATMLVKLLTHNPKSSLATKL